MHKSPCGAEVIGDVQAMFALDVLQGVAAVDTVVLSVSVFPHSSGFDPRK